MHTNQSEGDKRSASPSRPCGPLRRRHVLEEVAVDTLSRGHEQNSDSEHGCLKIGRTMADNVYSPDPDGVSPGKKRRLEFDLDLDLDLKLGAHVSRLPEDLLCFIFSLLHHPLHLYQCTPVCKLWNKLITNQVDLKGLWAKQEPWLLVRRSQSRFEMWCPVSGLRFPVSAKLIPEEISRQDELGLVRPAGSHQGLCLIQSEQGLLVWAPLSGTTELIPYPISPPPPAPHRRFASEFWVDSAEQQQAVFKIGHNTPQGLHLYDSSSGGWVFEETPSEIRQLGELAVNSTSKESCPFPAPHSFLKQYATDSKLGLGLWEEWYGAQRSVGKWYALMRDGIGSCVGVKVIWKPRQRLTAKVLRLNEAKARWRPLGKKSIYSNVSLCLPDTPPEVCTACSENLVVFAIGGRGTAFPTQILVFNLETRKWDELYSEINQDDDPIHVMAIFKPTLPHRNLTTV